MFFGVWDWLYLKGRIQVFNEKWGQDSGQNLCGVAENRLQDNRLHKNLIGNDKIEEPYWGPSCSHVVTQLIELVT